jgi:uncharacterized coiled-coil protein SlyX
MRDPHEIDLVSYDELESMCAERETVIHTLKRQIIDLEAERDRALKGLRVLEQGLRRRDCCKAERQS